MKYCLRTGEILENKKVAKDTYILNVKFKGRVFPTQFLLIDTYPARFLLKPFSISVYKDGVITVIYRVIGEGTKWLSNRQVGEKINFLGPLGNYRKFFEIFKKNKFKKIVLLAGGTGVASLINVYNYVKKFRSNIEFFYGEKSKDFVIDIKKFGVNNLVVCTEDGSYGEKGNVVEVSRNSIISDLNDIIIFVCGPKEMIKTVIWLLKNYSRFNCYVLLEEYMCCGYGVCRSCVVKVKKGDNWEYRTVCKDGPLFNVEEIILD